MSEWGLYPHLDVHVSVESTQQSMTSRFDIDCRHYGDRELGNMSSGYPRPPGKRQTSSSTDSSLNHRNSPTTETSHSLMDKARETRERKTERKRDDWGLNPQTME